MFLLVSGESIGKTLKNTPGSSVRVFIVFLAQFRNRVPCGCVISFNHQPANYNIVFPMIISQIKTVKVVFWF